MDTDANVPVVVQIGDIEYRLACPAAEVATLRSVADRLSEAMRELGEGSSRLTGERAAVMAALKIGFDLLKTQAQQNERERRLSQRFQALLGKLEVALSDGPREHV